MLVVVDGGGLGDEVDPRVEDARRPGEHLLDAADADCAGHAAHRKLHPRARVDAVRGTRDLGGVHEVHRLHSFHADATQRLCLHR